MRITGFTGAVKKDVPMVYIPCYDELSLGLLRPEADRIADYNTYEQPDKELIKDIKKYKYLVGILKTSYGKSGAGVIPIPQNLEIYEYENESDHVLHTDCSPIYVHGIGEFCFHWVYYLMREGELVTSCCCSVNFNKFEAGLTFSDDEYLIGTQFDEDGNYVGGSVFMLL